MPNLEIPFDLAEQWDQMLKTKGRCATYWEIAKWAYEKGRAEAYSLRDLELLNPPQTIGQRQ